MAEVCTGGLKVVPGMSEVNVCSILFPLKIFIKNGFLGKKLMFIFGYFRKNSICGVKMESKIYRKY